MALASCKLVLALLVAVAIADDNFEDIQGPCRVSTTQNARDNEEDHWCNVKGKITPEEETPNTTCIWNNATGPFTKQATAADSGVICKAICLRDPECHGIEAHKDGCEYWLVKPSGTTTTASPDWRCYIKKATAKSPEEAPAVFMTATFTMANPPENLPTKLPTAVVTQLAEVLGSHVNAQLCLKNNETVEISAQSKSLELIKFLAIKMSPHCTDTQPACILKDVSDKVATAVNATSQSVTWANDGKRSISTTLPACTSPDVILFSSWENNGDGDGDDGDTSAQEATGAWRLNGPTAGATLVLIASCFSLW